LCRQTKEEEMKKEMRPVVIYISQEERDALDALVKATQILECMTGERITRTSLARRILQQALPPFEAVLHAINEMARWGQKGEPVEPVTPIEVEVEAEVPPVQEEAPPAVEDVTPIN